MVPKAIAFLSTSLIAIAVSASPAAAQSAPAAKVEATTPPAPEILVTGFRASLKDAISIKRAAPAITDSISAEDIGKFPEQNLAESLQRITGVVITRNGGEGQFVSIRGLPANFVLTELDGRPMPSSIKAVNGLPGAFGGRSFDYSILASDFVNGVDVYKTALPDNVEGGMAGFVNIRLPDPTKVKKQSLALSAKADMNSYTSGVQPNLSALYQNRLLGGRLGLVAGISYTKRNIYSYNYTAYGLQPTVWWPATTGAGIPTNFPANAFFDNAQRFAVNIGEDRRTTGFAALSYDVSDHLTAYAQFLKSDYQNDFTGISTAIRFAGGAEGAIPVVSSPVFGATITEQLPGTTGVTGKIINTLTIAGADYRNDGVVSSEHDKLTQYAGGLKFHSGGWSVNLDVSNANATTEYTALQIGATGQASVTSTLGSGPAHWTFTPGYNPLEPTQFNIAGFGGQYHQPSSDEITAGKFDMKYEFPGGWLKSIQVGLRVSNEISAYQPQTISLNAQQLSSALNVPITTWDGSNTGIAAAPYMSQYTYNFLGQQTTFLSAANQSKFFAALPLSKAVALSGVSIDYAGFFHVAEKAYAAFARADFGFDEANISGNIGLRAVKTDVSSDGFGLNLNAITGLGSTNALTAPAGAPVSAQNSYSHFLPSLNLTWNPQRDIFVRFAASSTMSRPDLSSLTPAVSSLAGSPSYVINKGNPNLRPYTSQGVDLSFEWYFSKSSLLSVAGFYKKIKGFIETATIGSETHNVTIGSTTTSQTFTDFGPVNAGNTHVDGFEVGYQQAFTFLPKPFDGLGVIANYTYVDAGDALFPDGSLQPLQNVSKNNYTLVGYYENSRFGIRANYTYRSKYISSVPDSYFGDGDYVQGRGQLDLSANVHINSKIEAVAELINATNSAVSALDAFGINRGYSKDGRTIRFGVRVKI